MSRLEFRTLPSSCEAYSRFEGMAVTVNGRQAVIHSVSRGLLVDRRGVFGVSSNALKDALYEFAEPEAQS